MGAHDVVGLILPSLLSFEDIERATAAEALFQLARFRLFAAVHVQLLSGLPKLSAYLASFLHPLSNRSRSRDQNSGSDSDSGSDSIPDPRYCQSDCASEFVFRRLSQLTDTMTTGCDERYLITPVAVNIAVDRTAAATAAADVIAAAAKVNAMKLESFQSESPAQRMNDTKVASGATDTRAMPSRPLVTTDSVSVHKDTVATAVAANVARLHSSSVSPTSGAVAVTATALPAKSGSRHVASAAPLSPRTGAAAGAVATAARTLVNTNAAAPSVASGATHGAAQREAQREAVYAQRMLGLRTAALALGVPVAAPQFGPKAAAAAPVAARSITNSVGVRLTSILGGTQPEGAETATNRTLTDSSHSMRSTALQRSTDLNAGFLRARLAPTTLPSIVPSRSGSNSSGAAGPSPVYASTGSVKADGADLRLCVGGPVRNAAGSPSASVAASTVGLLGAGSLMTARSLYASRSPSSSASVAGAASASASPSLGLRTSPLAPAASFADGTLSGAAAAVALGPETARPRPFAVARATTSTPGCGASADAAGRAAALPQPPVQPQPQLPAGGLLAPISPLSPVLLLRSSLMPPRSPPQPAPRRAGCGAPSAANTSAARAELGAPGSTVAQPARTVPVTGAPVRARSITASPTGADESSSCVGTFLPVPPRSQTGHTAAALGPSSVLPAANTPVMSPRPPSAQGFGPVSFSTAQRSRSATPPIAANPARLATQV